MPEDVCKVNVAELMKNYPLSFLDKAEMALLNLSKKYPRIGDEILVDKDLKYVLYAGFSNWDGVMKVPQVFRLDCLGHFERWKFMNKTILSIFHSLSVMDIEQIKQAKEVINCC